MRNVSDKNCTENQNALFLFDNFFFNCAIYKIMSKNITQLDRPQITIQHMFIAFWVPKATNTQSEHEILNAFSLQQWLHEYASMLRYTYIACLGFTKMQYVI